MTPLTKWFNRDAPTGWGVIFVRTAEVAVVAFVVLQLKEWFDARAFDTPATAVDAVLVAVGVFVLNTILMWAKS